MRILLWCDDLMSKMRIGSAMNASGATVLKKTAEETPDCILMDLTARDAVDHIARLRAAHPDIEIIAFGPHVDGAAFKAAKAAGASDVVARGAVVERMQRRLKSA
jgi:DNA-binding NarL/FixJ family response regulator